MKMNGGVRQGSMLGPKPISLYDGVAVSIRYITDLRASLSALEVSPS